MKSYLSWRIIAREMILLLKDRCEAIGEPFRARGVLDSSRPFPLQWSLDGFSKAFLAQTADYLLESRQPFDGRELRIASPDHGVLESWSGVTVRVVPFFQISKNRSGGEYCAQFDVVYEPAPAPAA